MSVFDFLQLLILMFWWLPVGLLIRGCQILQERSWNTNYQLDVLEKCPDCGAELKYSFDSDNQFLKCTGCPNLWNKERADSSWQLVRRTKEP